MNVLPPQFAAERGYIRMKINSKNMAIVLMIVAGVLILGGISLFLFLVPGAASFFKVCLIIIGVLCILMGLGLLFTLYLGRDNDPNFFLYDTKAQRNLPVDELTFDRVNSRMSYFLTTLSTSQEKLWADNILADNGTGRFGVGDVYRPLTAYKMLYDLVELDRPEGWALFLCATPATMDSLLDALEENGEEAMSKALYHAYNSASGREDTEWLRDFLSGNAKYLRRRMLGYVQKNIEWFY